MISRVRGCIKFFRMFAHVQLTLANLTNNDITQMPRTELNVFRDGDDKPFLDWLDSLRKGDERGRIKMIAMVGRLQLFGSELRRPSADLLRDGIYELRARIGTVNFRAFYFFCGSNVACLSHGIKKKGDVPDADIEMALRHKKLVETNREEHTVEWEIPR